VLGKSKESIVWRGPGGDVGGGGCVCEIEGLQSRDAGCRAVIHHLVHSQGLRALLNLGSRQPRAGKSECIRAPQAASLRSPPGRLEGAGRTTSSKKGLAKLIDNRSANQCQRGWARMYPLRAQIQRLGTWGA